MHYAFICLFADQGRQWHFSKKEMRLIASVLKFRFVPQNLLTDLVKIASGYVAVLSSNETAIVTLVSNANTIYYIVKKKNNLPI